MSQLQLQRLVLDVLKPRQPNALEFSKRVLQGQSQCRIRLKVTEVDDKTETLLLELSGDNLDYDTLEGMISTLGGSVHSIDEVEVAVAASETQGQ